jgi:hypothetical protein
MQYDGSLKDLGFGIGITAELIHAWAIFKDIVAVSFIGGGNRSILRKPPNCRKSRFYRCSFLMQYDGSLKDLGFGIGITAELIHAWAIFKDN